MTTGFFNVSKPSNEPVLNYSPGSEEKEAVISWIHKLQDVQMDIPMVIGGEEVRSDTTRPITKPHDHGHILGQYHTADSGHVEQAIHAAMHAKPLWEEMGWEHRAAIFLKAADMLAGSHRPRLNAATMLSQSKNIFQAEIDAACELIDFFRFNVFYMTELYRMQPDSPSPTWNRMEYRPLEGFIFAVTPFNFTSIAGNLPTAPALMGNTVVWKPSPKQVYSAWFIMELLREAGLPGGVINLICEDGPLSSEVVFDHPEFGGVHFTGSTTVFRHFWKTVGEKLHRYRSYPRIVGETGGKDFILAHESADIEALSTAIVRGAFEYQGQKCSAASRAYIPDSIWEALKERLLHTIGTLTIGGPEDFTHFINAVIDENAFDKITAYIDGAKDDPMCEIIAGGNYDKSKGYFIEPTIILTHDPEYVTMREEIFGPVISIYVYQAGHFDDVLYLVDHTSPYGLTGAVFARDRAIIEYATRKLRNAAGNFYINDKPTGAVVGQQPFGGARASGTNDKAGSLLNLLRWVSPRAIKENFEPPQDYRYPFMQEQ